MLSLIDTAVCWFPSPSRAHLKVFRSGTQNPFTRTPPNVFRSSVSLHNQLNLYISNNLDMNTVPDFLVPYQQGVRSRRHRVVLRRIESHLVDIVVFLDPLGHHEKPLDEEQRE